MFKHLEPYAGDPILSLNEAFHADTRPHKVNLSIGIYFDEQGRIWLTCSVEYPYAAPNDRPAKDSIRVLEDTDGDGRFEKIDGTERELPRPNGMMQNVQR